jgi:hypothetical protein
MLVGVALAAPTSIVFGFHFVGFLKSSECQLSG